MKAMMAGFIAIIVIGVAANYGLGQAGFSSADGLSDLATASSGREHFTIILTFLIFIRYSFNPRTLKTFFCEILV